MSDAAVFKRSIKYLFGLIVGFGESESLSALTDNVCGIALKWLCHQFRMQHVCRIIFCVVWLIMVLLAQ